MEAYTYLGYQPRDFPVAFAQMDELLSLPMYAELTEEMIEYVCEQLIAAAPRVATA
jgi:dTDP-4-amino-4,6-dideoxygalactose transaminase